MGSRGNLAITITIIVTAVLIAGAGLLYYTNNKQSPIDPGLESFLDDGDQLRQTSPQPTPSIPSSDEQLDGTVYDTVSAKVSPDGKFTVTEKQVGDLQKIEITDSSGKVIEEDLIKNNYQSIGYGTKFGCQCGTTFKAWNDNTHFTIKIVNGGGEEYEYLVNALTGKVDEASFKKIN